MPTTPHTPDRPALHAAKDEPPETAVRRLLIAIVGLSPQVVTETLWALRTERGFVPDVVRVILTRSARDCVVKSLLDPVEGRFHAFCRDYGLVGKIHFDESCVTVVADGEGRELDDIRTPEESAAAADTIVRVIGNACSDPNVIVHVSIAGGRKSMGFFAGYAMSLFARPGDSVSHVLVNDLFESNRDFFYPPPEPKDIVNARGEPVSSSQARVMLADIPIVRLRTGLPENLLTGDASFGLAVKEAQRTLFPASALVLRADARGAVCDGVEVPLAPAQYAVLHWIGRARKTRGSARSAGTFPRRRRVLSSLRTALSHASGRHRAREEGDPLGRRLSQVLPGKALADRRGARKETRESLGRALSDRHIRQAPLRRLCALACTRRHSAPDGGRPLTGRVRNPITQHEKEEIMTKPILLTALFTGLAAVSLPAAAFQLYPDGTYGPDGDVTMAPDGSYHSGRSTQMYPDGSYGPSGDYHLRPEGSYGSGHNSYLRPDGSYGSTPDYELTPNGRYVDRPSTDPWDTMGNLYP